MSLRQMLFGAFCLAIFSGNSLASYYAWSPFADGRRAGSGFFGGPTHK
ncbi:MAG: hypothetical protein AB7F98_16510 [Novosphingobium sp.]